MNDETKRLLDLITRHLEGDLSSDDSRRLTLLLNDDSAREIFLEMATTHADLQLLLSVTPTRDEQGVRRVVPLERSMARRRFKKLTSYATVAVAASLLTVFTALTWRSLAVVDRVSRVSGDEDTLLEAMDPMAGPAEDRADSACVARIVRKIDCDWESDRWGLVSSPELPAGRSIMLAGGLMELEFTSGARVTLEAPVSFQIGSAMHGTLSYGKLTAVVPETAHGFTVSTPRGDTVDLGTAFGVVVTEDGATETHVFGGEVVVRPNDRVGDNSEFFLQDDMALRLVADTGPTDRLVAVPQRFTQIRFEKPTDRAKPPVDRSLAIWYSADTRVQSDEQGRVTSWGDLLTESNNAEQNAWQVDKPSRPLLVAEAIAGKPGLRFEGKQFLVTEPVPLEASQTLAVVFRADTKAMQSHRSNAEVGRQIMNLNGPPHLVLSLDGSSRLVSRMFVGHVTTPKERRDYLFAGKTISPEVVGNEPVVAVTVYDPEAESSRLYVNGKVIDEAQARRLESTNSPRYIGSHMFLGNTRFLGDVAEIMIYDTGLTHEEALRLSASLQEKYGVKTTTQVN